MASVRTNRQAWMDVLRCFAIFLVVVDHATDHINSHAVHDIVGLTTLNDAVGPFRMATLMFLSGMLLPRSLAKPATEFALGKLGRIGWPYVLWSFILLFLLAATSSISGNTSVDAGTFLQVFYAPPTYLWYLAYLLIFYFVVLVLRRAPVVRSLLIPIALIASQLLVATPQWQRMLFLFAFFLLGDLLSRHRAVMDRSLTATPIVVVAAALALATAGAAGAGVLVRYQAVWAIGVIAGIIVLIRVAQSIQESAVGAWMGRYGRDSIIFYVTHWVSLLVTYHVLVRSGIRTEWLLLPPLLLAAFGTGFISVWAQRWRVPRYLFALPLGATSTRRTPANV
ncbi:acyltransferase family protein [Microbacterium thalli]|uniref:acyltransferase family protein n=1 Tax=Microbacterium thalli TaxID=3027921 RepID=UPI0023661DEC|nr:acyltransferase [Microbacterium thalli]MDD7930056.1 acyltransferase [Microbacterium thalli]